jgi:hypothetical protein
MRCVHVACACPFPRPRFSPPGLACALLSVLVAEGRRGLAGRTTSACARAPLGSGSTICMACEHAAAWPPDRTPALRRRSSGRQGELADERCQQQPHYWCADSPRNGCAAPSCRLPARTLLSKRIMAWCASTSVSYLQARRGGAPCLGRSRAAGTPPWDGGWPRRAVSACKQPGHAWCCGGTMPVPSWPPWAGLGWAVATAMLLTRGRRCRCGRG